MNCPNCLKDNVEFHLWRNDVSPEYRKRYADSDLGCFYCTDCGVSFVMVGEYQFNVTNFRAKSIMSLVDSPTPDAALRLYRKLIAPPGSDSSMKIVSREAPRVRGLPRRQKTINQKESAHQPQIR